MVFDALVVRWLCIALWIVLVLEGFARVALASEIQVVLYLIFEFLKPIAFLHFLLVLITVLSCILQWCLTNALIHHSKFFPSPFITSQFAELDLLPVSFRWEEFGAWTNSFLKNYTNDLLKTIFVRSSFWQRKSWFLSLVGGTSHILKIRTSQIWQPFQELFQSRNDKEGAGCLCF